MININNAVLPDPASFKKTIDGKETGLYILKNNKGIAAAITNYGARWVSMLLPLPDGRNADVVVGFDSINGYLGATEPYYGAIIGRYANRIAKGQFSLDGSQYKLVINNPPNHLHGGIKGFHAVVWDVINLTTNSIQLSYISPDMEEGYPGDVTVNLIYRLTDENELRLDFHAVTDKATVICLTNHAYFNLNGQGSGSILEHSLMVNADNFTPIDNTSIPTGAIEPVEDGPFDFREGMKIGARIHEPSVQLTNGSGYDHNFILNDADLKEKLAADATGDLTGINLKVFTTEPGLQLYTGNFMNNENVLKGGFTDGKREAFCLETQHFPDSPNHPGFPNVILRPGEEYRSSTGFLFKI